MQRDYRTISGRPDADSGDDWHAYEDEWGWEVFTTIVAGPDRLPGLLLASAVFCFFAVTYVLFSDEVALSLASQICAASVFVGIIAIILTWRDILSLKRQRREYFARKATAWAVADKLDQCRDLVLGWAASGVSAVDIAARLSDAETVVSPEEVRNAVRVWEREASLTASEAASLVRSAKSARRK